MPRWSRGTDRTHTTPLDSDYDQTKKIASAHQRHDAERGGKLPKFGSKGSPGNPSNDLSGPSSNSASTRKRGGRR
jgi:hypothetical protein